MAETIIRIVFLLAVFLGIELIGRVPATLHTPLMSAANAVHGIVLVGAALIAVTADTFEVNEYFLEHPDMVLGELVTDRQRPQPARADRARAPRGW